MHDIPDLLHAHYTAQVSSRLLVFYAEHCKDTGPEQQCLTWLLDGFCCHDKMCRSHVSVHTSSQTV